MSLASLVIILCVCGNDLEERLLWSAPVRCHLAIQTLKNFKREQIDFMIKREQVGVYIF